MKSQRNIESGVLPTFRLFTGIQFAITALGVITQALPFFQTQTRAITFMPIHLVEPGLGAVKAGGGSVILITHQEEVALIADRASQLCAGRIIFSGSPRQAVDHFRGRTCVRCDGEVCNYVRS